MLIPHVIRKDEAGHERSFDIVSCLLKERIILLDDEINSANASIVISELLYLEAENNEAPITIYINSPGGSISDGLGIYDVMNNIKCPVHTICLGMAASMAAFLLCSGSKGKRYCLPNSTVMIHQPLGGSKGQQTEIEISYKRITYLRQKMNTIMAANTGKTVEEVNNATERDNYLTPEQALKFGLIDEIIPCLPKAYPETVVI